MKRQNVYIREAIMSYLKLWFYFYVNPKKYADNITNSPAPVWGLAATMQRAIMDAVLLYLPIALLGRISPESPYLRFISADNYYFALIGIAPVVLFLEWLLSASAIYLLLRLFKYRSSFDLILNISGFGALGIGSVLLIWDWMWILIGGMNQYLLGTSHLLIDIWGVAISAICLKVLFKVPTWLGWVANIIGIAVSMPFAIMFMRSPI
jgi:hypothetical protein